MTPGRARELAARTHRVALVAFAAMLALFEGPAEIACVVAILTAFATGGFRSWRPGVIEAGIVVWCLAGLYGTLSFDGRLPSEDKLRPLLALAALAGSRAVAPADARTLGRMGWVFAACLVANGAYGYLQVAFHELPLDRWLALNPSIAQRIVPDRAGAFAASGLFYNRLKLAHVGLVGLGVIGCALLSGRLRGRARGLAVAGALILGGAMVLTWARATWPALLAGALAVALVLASRGRALRPRSVAGVIVAAAALILGIGVSETGRERLLDTLPDIGVRMRLYRGAFAMFRDHPLLGVGHGVYPKLSPRYVEQGWGPHFIDAHNLFLHALAETGVVGFAGLATALAVAFVALARRVRSAEGAEVDARVLLDRVALFTLAALTALGLVHYPLHHATVALLFWAAVGVAAGGRRRC